MNHLLAAEGGETPQVLAVPIDELIIGIIAFFLVFLLLAKVALPAIKRTLAERTDAIEGGIARAEAAQAEAERLAAQYREQLAQARTEAASIRAHAQADRAAVVEEARSEAAAAAAAVTARAEAQMAAERAQTIASLRREVGDLAVSLAGKVVGESLTDDVRARATVERFLAELEQQTPAGSTEAGR